MQMNSKPVHVQHSDFQDLVTSFEKTKIKESALPVFIDTEIGMCSMVGKLQDLPTNPPSLYIDLEGINLLRHGSISILQIFVLPHGNTYLIDVFTLKENAFLQPAAVGDQNLKQILESSTIPKVFFDVRNDSDALFSHFKIHLAGVQDIQLMELATRNYSKKYVKGLAKCIEKDAPVSVSEMQSWKMWKEKGLELFAPERGGVTKYSTFVHFPMRSCSTVSRMFAFCRSCGSITIED